MTYDIALWKAKTKASDSAGLIALTLSEGCECKAVSRFPKTKLVRRLQELFDCSTDELPFEHTITGQGATISLPLGDALDRQHLMLIDLARELDLHHFDFQEEGPSDADESEFRRRIREQESSEDVRSFIHALEAANNGSAYHMHMVGSCFRYGTGVAKDHNKAIEWYERTAKSGAAKALVSLAEMYREDLGDIASLQAGIHCLQRGAELGSPSAIAMLAEWTRDGVGMAPDLSAAVELWRQLLATEAWIAAFELAKAYEHGIGVDPSMSHAIDYYRKARVAGHPEAYINLRRLGAEK